MQGTAEGTADLRTGWFLLWHQHETAVVKTHNTIKTEILLKVIYKSNKNLFTINLAM
jgi:hypothetical protein